jgi:hypothetical protein
METGSEWAKDRRPPYFQLVVAKFCFPFRTFYWLGASSLRGAHNETTQKESQVLDDAQLVRAAQGGDSTSLGLLLERYRAPLYGLALLALLHCVVTSVRAGTICVDAL